LGADLPRQVSQLGFFLRGCVPVRASPRPCRARIHRSFFYAKLLLFLISTVVCGATICCSEHVAAAAHFLFVGVGKGQHEHVHVTPNPHTNLNPNPGPDPDPNPDPRSAAPPAPAASRCASRPTSCAPPSTPLRRSRTTSTSRTWPRYARRKYTEST